MVLDGQCSCSGVITVSGKGHRTKNRTWAFKRSFQTVSFFSNSFQLRREEQHLITASLVHEMYDIYQVIDRNCKMQSNTASPFLCHWRAACRVSTKRKSMITVASSLADSNIFFSCFTGPIKSMYWLMQQYFQKYKTLQKALCLQGATAIQFQGWRRRCHWRSIRQTTSARCWN